MSDHMERPDFDAPPVRRGSTIQAMPGTALWATGARFGQVVAMKRSEALVALGRGRRLWVHVSAILEA